MPTYRRAEEADGVSLGCAQVAVSRDCGPASKQRVNVGADANGIDIRLGEPCCMRLAII
jgi:hypothetical protein